MYVHLRFSDWMKKNIKSLTNLPKEKYTSKEDFFALIKNVGKLPQQNNVSNKHTPLRGEEKQIAVKANETLTHTHTPTNWCIFFIFLRKA